VYESGGRWRVIFKRGRRTHASLSVDDAIAALLQAADQGLVRDRRGHVLTSSAVQELRWCLTGYVSQSLGSMALTAVRARDVKELVGELEVAGVSSRRLRPIVESVQTLYQYAIERGLAERNPALRIAAPEDHRHTAPPSRAAESRRADVVIGLGLRLATVGLALVGVVLVAQTL
jgi:site-specific recombinase XerC